MGAGFTEHDVAVNARTPFGIVKNHAYGILQVKEAHGHRLINLKNPYVPPHPKQVHLILRTLLWLDGAGGASLSGVGGGRMGAKSGLRPSSTPLPPNLAMMATFG